VACRSFSAIDMIFKIIPAMLAAGALASPAHAQWTPTLGIAARQFTLSEYDAAGRRIVREQGWLPGVEGRLAYRSGDWTLSAQASHYQHDIGYLGQTQSGAPVDSRTDTALTQSGAGIGYAINAVLSASLAFEFERWRRDIRGMGRVLGLQERTLSRRALLGLDARFPTTHGDVMAGAALLFAAPEKLRVGFSGQFDDVSFDTRPAHGMRLGLGWRPAAWPTLELQAGLDWWKVGRSADAALSRNGRHAGTVAQPEHAVTSMRLSVLYRF
jgi:hypothetical protein